MMGAEIAWLRTELRARDAYIAELRRDYEIVSHELDLAREDARLFRRWQEAVRKAANKEDGTGADYQAQGGSVASESESQWSRFSRGSGNVADFEHIS